MPQALCQGTGKAHRPDKRECPPSRVADNPQEAPQSFRPAQAGHGIEVVAGGHVQEPLNASQGGDELGLGGARSGWWGASGVAARMVLCCPKEFHQALEWQQPQAKVNQQEQRPGPQDQPQVVRGEAPRRAKFASDRTAAGHGKPGCR